MIMVIDLVTDQRVSSFGLEEMCVRKRRIKPRFILKWGDKRRLSCL